MLSRFIAAFAALFALMQVSAMAQNVDPNDTLILETTQGRVVIQLRPDLAPNHVQRVKDLAARGFYDNTPFHRVIDGFMAQGGDPTGTGAGGSDLPDLKREFTDTNFGRGVVGAARTNDKDSANSQFFICYQDCSFLNGEYTVWGAVVEGMENVDKFARGEPVPNPDRIVTARVGIGTN